MSGATRRLCYRATSDKKDYCLDACEDECLDSGHNEMYVMYPNLFNARIKKLMIFFYLIVFLLLLNRTIILWKP